MLLKAKIDEINCCPGVTPLIMTALDVPIFTPRACRSSSDPPHVPVIKRHPATVLLHEMGPGSFTWYSRSRRKNSCSSPVVPHHFLCLSVARLPARWHLFMDLRSIHVPDVSFLDNSDDKSFNLDVRRDVLSQVLEALSWCVPRNS